MRRARTWRRDEVGESLIELLMTIVILGLAVPAVMGAVLVSVSASSQDRRQVQAQALLTSWAATIARENTDATYTSCPSLAYYRNSPFAPPLPLPAGFSATVVDIAYWNNSSSFNALCTADIGARRLQLRVAISGGASPSFVLNQSVVVRKPCPAC